MRYKRLFSSGRTRSSQGYFKDGIELLYASQDHPIKIAILPAYDHNEPDNPTGWLHSIEDRDGMVENEFYTTVRGAKFVGHGNMSNRTSFVSPQTFDESAIDPYSVLYDYCFKSDEWSYLTKKGEKGPSGKFYGPVIPAPQDRFVANVMDLSLGERGGVFVVELGETITKQLLYENKDGEIKPGFLFGKEAKEFGDITNPEGAMCFNVSWGQHGYSIKPIKNGKEYLSVRIPEVLLQHRRHMEAPETFINQPGSAQDIVDRLAKILTGYKSPSGHDESAALKEALDNEFGERTYHVDVPITPGMVSMATPVVNKMSAEMQALLRKQGLLKEEKPKEERPEVKPKIKTVNPKKEKKKEEKAPTVDSPALASVVPGEQIDMSDIAAMREVLKGGKS
jgi:hypothetical protein